MLTYIKGLWSSGMMLALGARDREFDSPKSPKLKTKNYDRFVINIKNLIVLFLLNVSDLRNKSINRCGAEEARGAHNSEDIGSKPISGILVLAKLTAWCRHFLNRHGAEASARGS